MYGKSSNNNNKKDILPAWLQLLAEVLCTDRVEQTHLHLNLQVLRLKS